MKPQFDNSRIFDGLASEFTAIYYCDLDAGTYRNYVASEQIFDLKAQYPKFDKTLDLYSFYVENLVHPDQRQKMREFVPSNAALKASLAGRKRHSISYLRKYGEEYLWTEMTIVKCEAVDEEAHSAVITFIECDEDYRAESTTRACLDVLEKEQESDKSINELMALTGEFYGANRAYIFEYGSDRWTIRNTYEWCRDGVEPMIDRLQRIPVQQVAGWLEEFRRKGVFYMDNLASKGNNDDTRRTLMMQGIESLIAAPMLRDGEIVGFIGVDDPTRSKQNLKVMKTVATVAYSEMLKRKETLQQKLEESLAVAEAANRRNLTLQQIIKAGTWSFHFDSNGRVTGVTCSPECAAVIKNDVVAGSGWTKLVHPEDRDRVNAAFAAAINDTTGETPYDVEYRIRGRDGEYTWVHAAGRTIGNPDGSGELYGVCVDITETIRKRDEQQKAVQLQSFGHMINAVTWSMDVVGADEIVRIVWSEEFIAMLGYKDERDFPNELASWINILHPEDRDRVLEYYWKGIRSNDDGFVYDIEYRLRHHSGDYRWYHACARMETLEKEGVKRLYGIIVDISVEKALKAVSERNRILSEITRELYGYNNTVDLVDGSFNLIIGTGAPEAVDVIGRAKDYRESFDIMIARIRPEYHEAIRELLEFDRLVMNKDHHGFFGSVVYRTIGDEQTSRWGEANLTFGIGENGHPVANILGRDITEQHAEQERLSREREAEGDKERVMAEITRQLFGYNISVNLKTLEYTLIPGTGMNKACEIFQSAADYGTAVRLKSELVSEADRDRIVRMMEPESLRQMAAKGLKGSIGSSVYRAVIDGKEQWHETNVFIGSDRNGDPIANILGRDITAARNAQMRREREREATAAKDRVLSEITRSIYGYNLTVNLKKLTYTIIIGSGMEPVCDIFKAHDNYAKAIEQKIAFVDDEYRERMSALLKPEGLLRKVAEGVSGPIGAMTYSATVNGEHRWHSTDVFVGIDAEGDPVANILGRDITEQHERQERMQELERAAAQAKVEAAEETSRAKTAFLANMSHDIRTPMNAIIGFTDIARKHLHEPEKLDEYLDKVQLAGSNLLEIINDILDMSKIDSNTVEVTEYPAYISRMPKYFYTILSTRMKEHGHDFVCEVGDYRDDTVWIDKPHLNRIIINLLSNSLKYTAKGGRIRCDINQLEDRKAGYATFRITVEDNGIGMSEEFQKHLFERFTREKNSTVSGIQGTGIGMAIVKSLTDAMGGTIEVMSKEGVGTKFTLTFDFRRRKPGEGELGEDELEKIIDVGNQNGDAKRMMLVEDNEINREIALEILNEQGFDVDTAVNGKEAVDKATASAYDIILMDIMMPVMNGLEAAKAIRAAGITAPIIALSANAFSEDREASIAAGMNEHLAKPIKVKELTEALAKFV